MTASAAGRADRLLRWYPPSWRARYGEEFAELLRADIAERPADLRRTADVIRSGTVARLTAAGLSGRGHPTAEQIRAGLATTGGALAAFAVLGVAMLAQLATGWQRASAASAATGAGTVGMAVAIAILGAVGLAAAVPVCWQLAAAARRADRRFVLPVSLALGCAALLVIGTRHFENGWPGTGGMGPEHHLVPGGLAAFGWASTLSASSYWGHPALLERFPAAELAWMAVSPAAWIGLGAGLVMVTRRLDLRSGRVLRYFSHLTLLATAAAVEFLACASAWVLAHGSVDADPLRPGFIDGGELLAMALALIVAVRAGSWLRRARLSAEIPLRRPDGRPVS
jgi:hypothetical protein